jgi:transposase-like protein
MLFREALSDPGHPTARVINTDQAPIYGSAIPDIKKGRVLRRRCGHRPVQHLNNVLEIGFTQMTKPEVLTAQMGGSYVTDFDFAVGHEDAVD